MTEHLLISAMLVVPISGWLQAVAMPRKRNSSTAVSAGLVSVIAVTWMACVHVGVCGLSTDLFVGEWLPISSGRDLAVNLSFQIDQARCLLVLAASVISLLRVVGHSELPDDGASKLTVLYPLSVAAILANDLVVLVGIWILIDCCVMSIASENRRTVTQVSRRLNTTPVLSGSGAFLLMATLVAMARFGTSDLAKIVARSVDDIRVDAATVVSGLSVLFVAAAGVRCAFFPAMIWPRTCVDDRSCDAETVVVLAGALPGISLALSVFPLSGVAADGFLLLGTLGILTSLTATAVALVQKDSAGASALLTVGATGLAASALATGSPGAGPIAAATLFSQLVAIFVLRRCSRDSQRGFIAGIAMLAAVSGACGSNAVLSLVEASLRVNGDATVANSANRLLLLIWWGIIGSQILWGIAITKLMMNRTVQKKWSLTTTVVLAIAGVMAAGASALPTSVGGNAAPEMPVRLLSFDAATPACLLGVVAAWLFARASESLRQKVTASLDSITQLAREWFYLEDAVRYGMVMPVRCLAVILEAGDRKILGDTSEQHWQKGLMRIADAIDYLRSQPAIYYGLTGVLLVVGLLWSLS